MHSETKRRIAVGRKGVPLSPTHRANVVAALEANRKSGDEHPNATLNEAAVARIFELRKGGMLLREIGDAVGVSLAQVGNILRGSRRGTQTEGLRGEALPKPSVRDSACDAMRAARAVRDAWTTARLVEIQRRSDAGESDAALAAVYGLGVATIYAMRRRTGVYKPGYVNTKSRRSAPPTPARDRGHRGRCDALPRR